MPCARRQRRPAPLAPRGPGGRRSPDPPAMCGWSWPGYSGRGRGDVGPFGEARPPPLVVLGDGMELRQVERDDARAAAPIPPTGAASRGAGSGLRLRSRLAMSLKISVLPSPRRLEVVALGPLVPGVDEQQVFLGRVGLEPFDRGAEPLLVHLGRGPGDDRRARRAAGRVVETRRHAGKDLVWWHRAIEIVLHHRLVVVDAMLHVLVVRPEQLA